MKKFTSLASAFLLMIFFSWLCVGQARADGKLWSAITTSRPVFRQSETRKLVVFFAIVNDGKATVNPKIGESRLFINGKELKNWEFIVSNGPQRMYNDSLPPKKTVEFTYAMGDYFKTPGIYKLRWKGDDFEASEVTFRVLPSAKTK